ncbi:hypothetical protein [Enterovibrio norvegicus]|uniref:hypothetical protein n=1 Tax=Enterovibrio norvegicus TaxID=188144 RepID=UPI0010BF17F7|nr:hypothetical protein [Enterovibrio norvegicus]TKF32455.1 hypothetical protein FCV83_13100 [Enterovibrio norvegicus]
MSEVYKDKILRIAFEAQRQNNQITIKDFIDAEVVYENDEQIVSYDFVYAITDLLKNFQNMKGQPAALNDTGIHGPVNEKDGASLSVLPFRFTPEGFTDAENKFL